MKVHIVIIALMLLTWKSSYITAQEQSQVAHKCVDYDVGQKIHIQCRNIKGEWGPGPICAETGEEIYFIFGTDTFFHCGLAIPNIEYYVHIRRFVLQDDNWSCRIPMAPDHEFYIPFTIPIWGIAEPDHLHIDNHLNFVFHAEKGKLLGVSAYPVRDRFQFTKVGTVITMHGAVKWFAKETFNDFIPSFGFGPGTDTLGLIVLVLIGCAVTAVFSVVLFRCIYLRYLKPRVVRKVLKKD